MTECNKNFPFLWLVSEMSSAALPSSTHHPSLLYFILFFPHTQAFYVSLLLTVINPWGLQENLKGFFFSFHDWLCSLFLSIFKRCGGLWKKRCLCFAGLLLHLPPLSSRSITHSTPSLFLQLPHLHSVTSDRHGASSAHSSWLRERLNFLFCLIYKVILSCTPGKSPEQD